MSKSSLGAENRSRLNRGAAAMAGGFLVRFGAKGLFLATVVFLYGARRFGTYSLAVASVELFVTIAGLSMKKLLFKMLDDRESTASPAERVADGALTVVAASAVLGGVVAGGLWGTGQADGPVGRMLLMLLPMVAGQCLLDVSLTAIRWTGLVRYEVTTRSIAEPYAGLVASLIAFKLGFRETGLAIGYWVGTLAALGQAAYGLSRSFDLSPLRHYRIALRPVLAGVRANYANTLSDLANNLYQRVDTYIVGIVLGPRATGVYSFAKQFTTPITQIRQSYDALVVPLVSRELSEPPSERTAARIGEIIGLILNIQMPYLIALMGAGAVILGFFPATFRPALVPMIILAAGNILHASHGVADIVLAYRAPLRGFAITVTSMVIGAVAGWLLVPDLGLTGAALGIGISFIGRAMMRYHAVRALGVHIRIVPVFGRSVAGLAVAATVLAAFRLVLPVGSGTVLQIAATVLALAAFVALVRFAPAPVRPRPA